ncbi:transporter associated domain-containing protein [Oricola indica]|uniref:transporter associated domain-containing protein n=1 Tax=Oricola indica TaxID=2872591 RepID=UPI003CCC1715
MLRAGSYRRRKPLEPSDIIPRCRSLVPPCAVQKREKVDDFCAARSRTIPPLPWSSFPPPFSPQVTGGKYATVAGLVLDRIGHLPKPGEFVEHAGWLLEVVDLDRTRIDTLLVQRAPVSPDE